jgi:uncharacterized membrane protein
MMFNSLENARRKWVLPLMWALLSILWLVLGMRSYLERGFFYRGWLFAAMWGLMLVLSLYSLYRAFRRGAKD